MIKSLTLIQPNKKETGIQKIKKDKCRKNKIKEKNGRMNLKNKVKQLPQEDKYLREC